MAPLQDRDYFNELSDEAKSSRRGGSSCLSWFDQNSAVATSCSSSRDYFDSRSHRPPASLSTNDTMIVSIADEMNPTRRNTMEDAFSTHSPGSWGAPSKNAVFLGVYDGHGGRLMADYCEDNLAANVAREWEYAEGERKLQKLQQSKKRRIDECDEKKDDVGGRNNKGNAQSTVEKEEGEVIQTALGRAFLLTDVQSKLDGVSTSGATVVCCIVIPKLDGRGDLTSIAIHAANAGDARAVLSSCTARRRPLQRKELLGSENSSTNSKNSGRRSGGSSKEEAVRITHDHKSTDPAEIARIESSGGIMIRGRVLGVLAVARSLGDHGLKEYVIGKPYLSSTMVRIEDSDGCSDDDLNNVDDDASGNNDNTGENDESILAATAPYTDGEFVIVACDGLWDVFEDQEAVDFVRDHVDANGKKSREEVASFLIKEALRLGSTDNITVIVYWL